MSAVLEIEAKPTPRLGASADFLRCVPHEFARRHLILSEGAVDGLERVMVAARTKPWAVHNVGVALGREVAMRTENAEVIAAAIDEAYAKASSADEDAAAGDVSRVVVEGAADVEAELEAALRETERDLLSTQGKAPAVRLVDLILFEALLRSASDVHVQPVRGGALVRYRLDGVLHTVRELPMPAAAGVVSRIKVMSRLDVAETRAPQDGRATVTIGGSGGSQAGRRVDLRVSTLPSTYGERIVVRLLDPARSAYLLNFTGLGMPAAVEREYLHQCSRTSGIVLATGPTGSGKTTTLYTTLAWISSSNAGSSDRGCELNMMTVEDPVEYDLSGGNGGRGLAVSQTQVDAKKNVTFASGLRHILRQDPDVIMVGEIRDQDTARIGVQASLTGHLVLSTLHTNDAPSAVVRLIDLGIEPFLVASSLGAVLAQRLVRKVHGDCDGKGCDVCLGTGYRGRTAVFELLVMTPDLRELVGQRASSVQIASAAKRSGMTGLREAGMGLVQDGVTTVAEISRVIEAVVEREA